MHDVVHIHFLDAWEESKHPRGKGKKGGQFVRKGEAGTGSPNVRTAAIPTSVHGAVRASATGVAESGKTPIGAFVAARLASGDSPEQIAEQLKVVTAAHKNPQYINKMYRQIEKLHGLTPGVLGKPGAKSQPKNESAPPSPQPKKESVPGTEELPYKPQGAKATNAELDALVSSKKVMREKMFHAKAWNHATSDFVKLATSVAPVGDVPRLKNKSAHYHPGYGKWGDVPDHINMPYDDDTSEAALSTWRHEYGHKIDWARGKQYGTMIGPWYVNASYQFHGVLVLESKKLAAAYANRKEKSSSLHDKAKQKAVMDKHGITDQELNAFVDASGSGFGTFNKAALLGAIHNGFLADSITRCAHDSIASSRLHDFYGPITKNKMGWGHSTAYYNKNPHFRTAEAFANYVALTQGKHGKIYKALLHATAPKLCAGFEKLLES